MSIRSLAHFSVGLFVFWYWAAWGVCLLWISPFASTPPPPILRVVFFFHLWFTLLPWRRTWQPTPVLLPGKSHGQRSLVGYSPWGHKESDTTERLHCCSNTFKVNEVPFVWFWFSFFQEWIQSKLAVIYSKACSACISLKRFIVSVLHLDLWFGVYFSAWV